MRMRRKRTNVWRKVVRWPSLSVILVLSDVGLPCDVSLLLYLIIVCVSVLAFRKEVLGLMSSRASRSGPSSPPPPQ